MERTWLKEARAVLKLTTYEVAERAGISQGFYAQIESGKRQPSIAVAKRIAGVLFFPWTDFYRDAA